MPGPRVPPHLHLFRGLTGALLLTILIILTLGPAVFARELLGQASVIDGDTWKAVDGERVKRFMDVVHGLG